MSQPTMDVVLYFFIGQKIRIYARSTQDNVLTNPSECTIFHRDPSDNEATEIYNGGAGNVVREATGIHYLDLTLDEAGEWFLRTETTGVVAAYERKLIVYESYFASP